MADVFISYARADRKRVEQIASALEEEGFSVWWDARLNAGDSFDTLIERELDQAKCVVVVWSKSSVNRKWVRNEAREGENRGILAPVTIDGSPPPLEFRNIQTEDLSGWQGSLDNGQWRQFVESVSDRVNDPSWAPVKRRASAGDEYALTVPFASMGRGTAYLIKLSLLAIPLWSILFLIITSFALSFPGNSFHWGVVFGRTLNNYPVEFYISLAVSIYLALFVSHRSLRSGFGFPLFVGALFAAVCLQILMVENSVYFLDERWIRFVSATLIVLVGVTLIAFLLRGFFLRRFAFSRW